MTPEFITRIGGMKRYYFLLDRWYPRPTKRHLEPAVQSHGKEFSVSGKLGAYAKSGLAVSAVGAGAATSYVYHAVMALAIVVAVVDWRMAHSSRILWAPPMAVFGS